MEVMKRVVVDPSPAAWIARLTDSKPPSPPIPALRTICAWCQPIAERTNPANRGVSHGICAACQQKAEAEIDASAARKAA
jgi:hypothetical protein